MHSRQDHYKALGQTVADTKLEHVRAQMAAFKQGLEGFALKHRQVHIKCLFAPHLSLVVTISQPTVFPLQCRLIQHTSMQVGQALSSLY